MWSPGSVTPMDTGQGLGTPEGKGGSRGWRKGCRMAGGDHRPPRQMAGSPAVWPWASPLAFLCLGFPTSMR